MPLERREFLSEIILTSQTCPTFWKNSSKSWGDTFAASCIHITVRRSLSTEGGSALGDGLLAGGPNVMGREEGLLPRGEGDFLWYRRWLREGDPRNLSRELERDRLRRSLEWERDRLRRSLEPERDLLRLLSLEWR